MLVCLSANHRTTPFAALEQLSATDDAVRSGLSHAHESISGAIVVATCNRFEAYLDVGTDDDHSAEPAVGAALTQISAASGLSYRDLHESIDFTVGDRVAHHLFSVAAGLDSVAVGEDEIAGQVRRAYDSAKTHGTTTRSLEHLFERASETSRAVKNSARVGEAGRSLVRLALELTSSRVLDWATTRVALVGTGRYAAAALAALRARGASDIAVISGSGRGAEFAERHGLDPVAPDAHATALATASVVVTCTTREAVTAELLHSGRVRATHPAQHQVFVDLGMPRNVAADVRDLPGVEVLDLDTIRLHAPIDEFASLADARAIVDAAAQRHASARRVHDVAPAVVTARTWVQHLLEAEIVRLPGREGAAETERALRHFAGVMMHHLVAEGHTLASRGDGATWSNAVATVFGQTRHAQESQMP